MMTFEEWCEREELGGEAEQHLQEWEKQLWQIDGASWKNLDNTNLSNSKGLIPCQEACSEFWILDS